MRARAWCFTVNNPTEADWDCVRRVAGMAKYLVAEAEVGEQGTPHIQGYVYFADAVSPATAKTLIGERSHIAAAKGTAAQNKLYCTKEKVEGQPWNGIEIGVMPAQGKRNDLAAIRERLNRGDPLADVIAEVDTLQGLQTAERLVRYAPMAERRPVVVKWFHGPTGTGKTREAWVQAGQGAWVSSDSLKWFDGYAGQRTVIIDDLRFTHVDFAFLLRVLDRYPLRVPVKCGFVPWQPELIIVTSCHDPRMFAQTSQEDLNQLVRRITEIRAFP